MTLEVVRIEDRTLALQELETRFAMAVRQRSLLEMYIRERLKPGKHFYQVGNDPERKPSLTKEGAELICLPHNAKPRYDILSGPEKPPADNSPYQVTVKCTLWRNEIFEGEGLGSASSHITKKDGTYQPRQPDPGLCHNATVKMACKSAYIAATLNSTAASEFFTQDLEDDQTGNVATEKASTREHWCAEHKTFWFKKGKMKAFGHPIKDENGRDTGEWCHEHKKSPTTASPSPNGDAPPSDTQASTPTAGTSPSRGQPGEKSLELAEYVTELLGEPPRNVASPPQAQQAMASTESGGGMAPQTSQGHPGASQPVFRNWGECWTAITKSVPSDQFLKRASALLGRPLRNLSDYQTIGSMPRAWEIAQEIKAQEK